jgi:hypothetical protein
MAAMERQGVPLTDYAAGQLVKFYLEKDVDADRGTPTHHRGPTQMPQCMR